MTFDFLRHGATESSGAFCGSTDVALSAHGWAQMRQAVAGEHWDAIVSSPLRRCAEFACELAAQRQIAVTYETRWRELHFGTWEGKRSADLPIDALALFWNDPWLSPPAHGGEALSSFEARVMSAWHARRQHHVGMRVLVVTHAGVIRMLRCHARGLSPANLLSIDVPHASLHRIERGALS